MTEFRNLRLGDAYLQGQEMAANRFRLGEVQRGIQARTGLTAALQAGTPEAMQQYSKQFPQEAMQYQQQSSTTRKAMVEEELFKFQVVEKLMSGVRNEPTYQQARQLAAQAGLDTSKMPPNYDPAFIEQNRRQALGVKGQLEEELKRLTLAEQKRHHLAMEGRPGQGEGGYKQSDVRGLRHDVRRALVEYHGGMYVAQPDGSFRITGLDKGLASRVQGLAERGSGLVTQQLKAGAMVDPEQITSQVLREAGLPVGSRAAEPSQVPSGMPPGSRQIGTSQGKPVYQAPDGKKYVVD